MTESQTDNDSQYTLTKILTIWAAVAVPMPIMAFWLAPAVAARSTMHPLVMIWFLLL
jgi:hypothetical protein